MKLKLEQIFNEISPTIHPLFTTQYLDDAEIEMAFLISVLASKKLPQNWIFNKMKREHISTFVLGRRH